MEKSCQHLSVENVKELARGSPFPCRRMEGNTSRNGGDSATRESLSTKIAQQRKFTKPFEMKC
uniref:Uncharacterized protein n=1 Tax=Oryza glumipatula TaxID=40148 RepID=A0A0D9Y340_9ORYZ